MGPLQQPIEHQIATLPKNQSGRIPHSKDGSIKNPLPAILGGLQIGASIFSTIYTNRRNKEIAQQQNEYNERMIEKQNKYNSPEAQIQRYIDAGFTESQARQMLFGTPNAGLQESAPTATPYEYSGNFGDAVAQGLGAFTGLQAMENESNLTTQQIANLRQDQAIKATIAKYQEDEMVANINHLNSLTNASDARAEGQKISNRIASMTADDNIKALTATYAKAFIESAPFLSMSPANQDEYIRHKMENLLKQSKVESSMLDSQKAEAESNKSMYDFLKSLYDYKHSHKNIFYQAELDEALARSARAKADSSISAFEKKNADWNLSHWSTIASALTNELDARIANSKYESQVARTMSANATTLATAYFYATRNGLIAQQNQSEYTALFYKKCTEYGVKESWFKNVMNNAAWAIGFNTSSVTMPNLQNSPSQMFNF